MDRQSKINRAFQFMLKCSIKGELPMFCFKCKNIQDNQNEEKYSENYNLALPLHRSDSSVDKLGRVCVCMCLKIK